MNIFIMNTRLLLVIVALCGCLFDSGLGRKRASSVYHSLDTSKNFPLGEFSSEGKDPSLIKKDFETSDLRYLAEKATEISQQGTWDTLPRLAQNESDLSRIAFGEKATSGAMEFAVYLDIYSKDGYYTCGGSLIGKKTVVTAAHCFFDERGSLSASRAIAVVGRHDIRNPSSKYVYDVVGIVRPKDFIPGSSYDLFGDIALLELDRTATTGEKISLASYSTKVPYWHITAGWGLTEDNRRSSDILRYAAVPSLSVSQVSSWVKYSGAYYQMEQDHIAAGLGSDRADSCSGDSGGPLFKPGKDFTNSESSKDVLFGVVSYGLSSQCGPRQNMNIGFYTSIAYWRNWIRKEMKKRNWSS